jgi:hypothetical protein
VSFHFGSEIGVRADMLAPVSVLDGELSATARINPAARQYATIAILGLPIVMTSQKTGIIQQSGTCGKPFSGMAGPLDELN